MDEALKKALKELLKEHLEVSVSVWEDSNGDHYVDVFVEFDGEIIAEQNDNRW